MKKLHIESRTYELPESMNEMSVKQLVFLSTLVAGEVPIQEVKVKMLLHCLDARIRPMRNPEFHRLKIGGDVFALTTEQITQVSVAFDYLFTKPNDKGECFLDNRLVVNHYQDMTIDGMSFYGPGTALEGITYDQYIYLQVYDQLKDRNPESMYNWLACFFVPTRGKFTKDLQHVEAMKHVSEDVILLCMWFWIGSCRAIADKFPRIFADGDGGTDGNVYDGQQKLLNYIAKADPVKTKQYKEDELYNILYSLDYMLELEEAKTPNP